VPSQLVSKTGELLLGNLPRYPQTLLVAILATEEAELKIDPCGNVPKFPVTSTSKSDDPAQI
jgi:hypothetical protein